MFAGGAYFQKEIMREEQSTVLVVLIIFIFARFLENLSFIIFGFVVDSRHLHKSNCEKFAYLHKSFFFHCGYAKFGKRRHPLF